MSEHVNALQVDPRPQGGLRTLLAEVAAYYDLKPADLLRRDRCHALSHPRQAFMWHARQLKWPDGRWRYSLNQIASFLGIKDHTGIRHGVIQHEKRLRSAEKSGSAYPSAFAAVDQSVFTVVSETKQRTIVA